MVRRLLTAVLAAFVLVGAFAFPTSAGNWATVEPDSLLGSVEAGQTVTFGFTVLQHGQTPFNDADPVVTATHRDTGEVISATAEHDGDPGHYVAEITFPVEGDWVWSITPFPFQTESSLPTLTVRAPGALGDALNGDEFSAAIVPVCGGTAAAIFDLADFSLPRTLLDDGATDANPILQSESTLPISLSDLLASRPAISARAAPSAPLACGQILGQPLDHEVIVGLFEADGSGYAGIARITEEDGRSVVSVYLAPGLASGTAPGPEVGGIPSATTVLIEGTAFGPAMVEVRAGTAVTWINHDAVTHEVAFDDISLDDSGLFSQDEHFTQYFTTPGTYPYVCGPHAGMEGTVVVI